MGTTFRIQLGPLPSPLLCAHLFSFRVRVSMLLHPGWIRVLRAEHTDEGVLDSLFWSGKDVSWRWEEEERGLTTTVPSGLLLVAPPPSSCCCRAAVLFSGASPPSVQCRVASPLLYVGRGAYGRGRRRHENAVRLTRTYGGGGEMTRRGTN